ncbi:MAG: hypothetical protein GF408_07170, partial [Candidatus Omnitrophica bacterium]|nr:hypothetical protein [Candidatus Omnitrophota bacterium]
MSIQLKKNKIIKVIAVILIFTLVCEEIARADGFSFLANKSDLQPQYFSHPMSTLLRQENSLKFTLEYILKSVVPDIEECKRRIYDQKLVPGKGFVFDFRGKKKITVQAGKGKKQHWVIPCAVGDIEEIRKDNLYRWPYEAIVSSDKKILYIREAEGAGLPEGFNDGNYEWVPGEEGELIRDRSNHSILARKGPDGNWAVFSGGLNTDDKDPDKAATKNGSPAAPSDKEIRREFLRKILGTGKRFTVKEARDLFDAADELYEEEALNWNISPELLGKVREMRKYSESTIGRDLRELDGVLSEKGADGKKYYYMDKSRKTDERIFSGQEISSGEELPSREPEPEKTREQRTVSKGQKDGQVPRTPLLKAGEDGKAPEEPDEAAVVKEDNAPEEEHEKALTGQNISTPAERIPLTLERFLEIAGRVNGWASPSYGKGQIEAINMLREGTSIELSTGAGKPLTLAAAALMRHLERGEKILILTHEDALTEQAMQNHRMGEILSKMGVVTGFILPDDTGQPKGIIYKYGRGREAAPEEVYRESGILYSKWDRVVHRYMAEKMGSEPAELMKNKYFTLFDEADRTLVFGAATPAVISGNELEHGEERLYLRRQIDEFVRTVLLRDESTYYAPQGTEEVYISSKGENLSRKELESLAGKSPVHAKIVKSEGEVFVRDALRAHLFYREGERFFVSRDPAGEKIGVVACDEDSGAPKGTVTRDTDTGEALKKGMSFEEGLQQAIEIMAGIPDGSVTPERYTRMSMTVGQFIDDRDIVIDFSGAIGTMEIDRFRSIYGKKGEKVKGVAENLISKGHTGFNTRYEKIRELLVGPRGKRASVNIREAPGEEGIADEKKEEKQAALYGPESASRASERKRLLAEADSAMLADDIESAESKAEEVLRKDPENKEALQILEVIKKVKSERDLLRGAEKQKELLEKSLAELFSEAEASIGTDNTAGARVALDLARAISPEDERISRLDALLKEKEQEEKEIRERKARRRSYIEETLKKIDDGELEEARRTLDKMYGEYPEDEETGELEDLITEKIFNEISLLVEGIHLSCEKGQTDRARSLLEDIKTLDPEHPSINELDEAIRESEHEIRKNERDGIRKGEETVLREEARPLEAGRDPMAGPFKEDGGESSPRAPPGKRTTPGALEVSKDPSPTERTGTGGSEHKINRKKASLAAAVILTVTVAAVVFLGGVRPIKDIRSLARKVETFIATFTEGTGVSTEIRQDEKDGPEHASSGSAEAGNKDVNGTAEGETSGTRREEQSRRERPRSLPPPELSPDILFGNGPDLGPELEPDHVGVPSLLERAARGTRDKMTEGHGRPDDGKAQDPDIEPLFSDKQYIAPGSPVVVTLIAAHMEHKAPLGVPRQTGEKRKTKQDPVDFIHIRNVSNNTINLADYSVSDSAGRRRLLRDHSGGRDIFLGKAQEIRIFFSGNKLTEKDLRRLSGSMIIIPEGLDKEGETITIYDEQGRAIITAKSGKQEQDVVTVFDTGPENPGKTVEAETSVADPIGLSAVSHDLDDFPDPEAGDVDTQELPGEIPGMSGGGAPLREQSATEPSRGGDEEWVPSRVAVPRVKRSYMSYDEALKAYKELAGRKGGIERSESSAETLKRAMRGVLEEIADGRIKVPWHRRGPSRLPWEIYKALESAFGKEYMEGDLEMVILLRATKKRSDQKELRRILREYDAFTLEAGEIFTAQGKGARSLRDILEVVLHNGYQIRRANRRLEEAVARRELAGSGRLFWDIELSYGTGSASGSGALDNAEEDARRKSARLSETERELAEDQAALGNDKRQLLEAQWELLDDRAALENDRRQLAEAQRELAEDQAALRNDMAQLEEARRELAEDREAMANDQRQLEEAIAEGDEERIAQELAEIEDNRIEIRNGEARIRREEAEIADDREEIWNGYQKIHQELQEISDNEQEIRSDLERIRKEEEEIAENRQEIREGKRKKLAQEKELEEALEKMRKLREPELRLRSTIGGVLYDADRARDVRSSEAVKRQRHIEVELAKVQLTSRVVQIYAEVFAAKRNTQILADHLRSLKALEGRTGSFSLSAEETVLLDIYIARTESALEEQQKTIFDAKAELKYIMGLPQATDLDLDGGEYDPDALRDLLYGVDADMDRYLALVLARKSEEIEAFRGRIPANIFERLNLNITAVWEEDILRRVLYDNLRDPSFLGVRARIVFGDAGREKAVREDLLLYLKAIDEYKILERMQYTMAARAQDTIDALAAEQKERAAIEKEALLRVEGLKARRDAGLGDLAQLLRAMESAKDARIARELSRGLLVRAQVFRAKAEGTTRMELDGYDEKQLKEIIRIMEIYRSHFRKKDFEHAEKVWSWVRRYFPGLIIPMSERQIDAYIEEVSAYREKVEDLPTGHRRSADELSAYIRDNLSVEERRRLGHLVGEIRDGRRTLGNFIRHRAKSHEEVMRMIREISAIVPVLEMPEEGRPREKRKAFERRIPLITAALDNAPYSITGPSIVDMFLVACERGRLGPAEKDVEIARNMARDEVRVFRPIVTVGATLGIDGDILNMGNAGSANLLNNSGLSVTLNIPLNNPGKREKREAGEEFVLSSLIKLKLAERDLQVDIARQLVTIHSLMEKYGNLEVLERDLQQRIDALRSDPSATGLEIKSLESEKRRLVLERKSVLLQLKMARNNLRDILALEYTDEVLVDNITNADIETMLDTLKESMEGNFVISSTVGMVQEGSMVTIGPDNELAADNVRTGLTVTGQREIRVVAVRNSKGDYIGQFALDGQKVVSSDIKSIPSGSRARVHRDGRMQAIDRRRRKIDTEGMSAGDISLRYIVAVADTQGRKAGEMLIDYRTGDEALKIGIHRAERRGYALSSVAIIKEGNQFSLVISVSPFASGTPVMIFPKPPDSLLDWKFLGPLNLPGFLTGARFRQEKRSVMSGLAVQESRRQDMMMRRAEEIAERQKRSVTALYRLARKRVDLAERGLFLCERRLKVLSAHEDDLIGRGELERLKTRRIELREVKDQAENNLAGIRILLAVLDIDESEVKERPQQKTETVSMEEAMSRIGDRTEDAMARLDVEIAREMKKLSSFASMFEQEMNLGTVYTDGSGPEPGIKLSWTFRPRVNQAAIAELEIEDKEIMAGLTMENARRRIMDLYATYAAASVRVSEREAVVRALSGLAGGDEDGHGMRSGVELDAAKIELERARIALLNAEQIFQQGMREMAILLQSKTGLDIDLSYLTRRMEDYPDRSALEESLREGKNTERDRTLRHLRNRAERAGLREEQALWSVLPSLGAEISTWNPNSDGPGFMLSAATRIIGSGRTIRARLARIEQERYKDAQLNRVRQMSYERTLVFNELDSSIREAERLHRIMQAVSARMEHVLSQRMADHIVGGNTTVRDIRRLVEEYEDLKFRYFRANIRLNIAYARAVNMLNELIGIDRTAELIGAPRREEKAFVVPGSAGVQPVIPEGMPESERIPHGPDRILEGPELEEVPDRRGPREAKGRQEGPALVITAIAAHMEHMAPMGVPRQTKEEKKSKQDPVDFIHIRNFSDGTVNLADYSLADSSGKRYSIRQCSGGKDIFLGKGEEIRIIFSGDDIAEEDLRRFSGIMIIVPEGLNSEGETVTIYGPDGRKVFSAKSGPQKQDEITTFNVRMREGEVKTESRLKKADPLSLSSVSHNIFAFSRTAAGSGEWVPGRTAISEEPARRAGTDGGRDEEKEEEEQIIPDIGTREESRKEDRQAPTGPAEEKTEGAEREPEGISREREALLPGETGKASGERALSFTQLESNIEQVFEDFSGRGEISRNAETVECDIRPVAGIGRYTIERVRAEGDEVEKGDWLVKFDSTPLERAREEEIRAANETRRGIVLAEETIKEAGRHKEAVVLQYQEDSKAAVKKIRTAEKMLRQTDTRIEAAEDNVRLAEEYLKMVKALYEQDVVSEFEVNRAMELRDDAVRKMHEAHAQRAGIARTLEEARAEHKLLKALFARETRRLEGIMERANNDLSAAKDKLELQEKKLELLEESIKRCVIYASRPGIVVHSDVTGVYFFTIPLKPAQETVIGPGLSVAHGQEVVRVVDRDSMLFRPQPEIQVDKEAVITADVRTGFGARQGSRGVPIKEILPEGTSVSKGDVIARFDDSVLLDMKRQAEEGLCESRRRVAEAISLLASARSGRSKYMETEYPALLKDAEAALAEARVLHEARKEDAFIAARRSALLKKRLEMAAKLLARDAVSEREYSAVKAAYNSALMEEYAARSRMELALAAETEAEAALERVFYERETRMAAFDRETGIAREMLRLAREDVEVAQRRIVFYGEQIKKCVVRATREGTLF